MSLKKIIHYILLLTTFIFSFTSLTACGSNKTSEKYSFGIEELQEKMLAKNYSFQVKAAAKEDFFDAPRKVMLINNDIISIYTFNSNETMEKHSKYIKAGGSTFKNGSKVTKVDWAHPAHVFKKGSIIVLYAGNNEKIIEDLRDILGKEFT